jgi:multiple antibiotic resistance protein
VARATAKENGFITKVKVTVPKNLKKRYLQGSVQITPSAAIGVILTVMLVHAPNAEGADSFRSSISSAHVDLGEAFTFFFLMLGPTNVLAPFAKITEGADVRFRRQLAVRATVFSCLALGAAAFVGQKSLHDYGVSLNVLALTAGFVLSAVAFQRILEQFHPGPIDKAAAETPSLQSAVLRLAFPTIITPYGIAAVIILTAIASDTSTKIAIFLIALGILLLDLLAMFLARPLLKWLGAPLLILNAVLAIIQLAFGVQVIVTSLAAIGVFSPRFQ